jgi:hypothetical protein
MGYDTTDIYNILQEPATSISTLTLVNTRSQGVTSQDTVMFMELAESLMIG